MELQQITECCKRDGGFLFTYDNRIICRRCHVKDFYAALKQATKITLLTQETIDKLATEN